MRSLVAGSAFALAVAAPALCGAAQVEGVRVPDRVQVAAFGPGLVLNGAGVRTRFIFQVYVGALYLQHRIAAAPAVLADAGPKRVALHLLRELSSEQLFSAMMDGLKANHSAAVIEKFTPQMSALEGIFGQVSAVKPGDIILLDYIPGTGTIVSVNGIEKGRVPGGEFNQALLRIWLGDHPADSDLKRAMLGGG